MVKNTFTTLVQYKNFVESKCQKAVENSCEHLLNILKELIQSEYYDEYTPQYYKRTEIFMRSATMKMLDKCMGEIFMDESSMNYGEYWDGEIQLEFASRGYHGTIDIQTNGRFWDSFIDYCKDNAINILKSELIKQGLTIV